MAEPGSDPPARTSRLSSEIASIPELARVRLDAISDVDALAAELRALSPRFVVTIGRGSSDAVCEAIGRAAGVHAGLIAASLPPSLVTLDHARLDARDALAIVVSQSGRSPDIIEAARAVRAGGARVVGIVNAPGSPLEAVCDHVLAVGAVPEISVAATKSVVLSWLVGLRLVTLLGGGSVVGWDRLPDLLAQALACEPPADILDVLDAPQIVVLGRGATLAAAREIALKIKELSGIDAEAISGAEVLHGPRAAIGPDTALLGLATDGGPLGDALEPLSALTSRIVVAGPAARAWASYGKVLDLPSAPLASADPLLVTAALYRLAMALAIRRGRDPDQPQGLSKVTLTR